MMGVGGRCWVVVVGPLVVLGELGGGGCGGWWLWWVLAVGDGGACVCCGGFWGWLVVNDARGR